MLLKVNSKVCLIRYQSLTINMILKVILVGAEDGKKALLPDN